MIFPFGETVILHTRTVTGEDSDGNDVYGDVPLTVDGCVFDPGSSTELIQGQDTVLSHPTVYLPAGYVVTAVDKVTARGVTYNVDGVPKEYRSPYTATAYGPVLALGDVTG